MKPFNTDSISNHIARRPFVFAMLGSSLGLMVSTGCSSFMKQQEKPVREQIELPETVGEITRPYGLGTVTIENVGLITGLSGTGSDPPPSGTRQALIEDMKRRKVDNPHQHLASPSTALVVVRASMPPGTQKGDRIDVDVRVPARSKTTSLEAGWLMETQLKEVAILNDSVHSGHVRGVVEGAVLPDGMVDEGTDKVSHTRGVILGGGVATKSRPLGLTLRTEHHDASISKLVGAAVNHRFDSYVRGRKQGAATPKTDKFIELTLHPRYRHNLVRYLRVIEQIKLRENQQQLIQRLQTLEGELLVPSTSGLAALKLEAIGDEAANTLLRGLDSPSAEVRFYAAEALAYLDNSVGAALLGESVAEPAFRSRALLALSAMSSVDSHDQLSQLLNANSAETRYGAFQALQRMNPRDPMLGQDARSSHVYLHEIASQGTPMVHVSRRSRPEIVLFGLDQKLVTPLVLLVGKQFVIKADTGSKLRVTQFTSDGDDQTHTCEATMNELLRTLVLMEARYPQLVSAIQQAKDQGALQSRVDYDAIPEAGRTYNRAASTAVSTPSTTKTL